jgi:hypothetical protein
MILNEWRMPILLLAMLLVLASCSLYPSCSPYDKTIGRSDPFDAAVVSELNCNGGQEPRISSARLILEEKIVGGVVLLYVYPTDSPGEHILTQAFVTQEKGTGPTLWFPATISCGVYTETQVFFPTYTVGGSNGPSTAFGISKKGNEVRIEWSDGQVDVIPVENGAFLQSRQETVWVQRVELLDAEGDVLESQVLKPPR